MVGENADVAGTFVPFAGNAPTPIAPVTVSGGAAVVVVASIVAGARNTSAPPTAPPVMTEVAGEKIVEFTVNRGYAFIAEFTT